VTLSKSLAIKTNFSVSYARPSGWYNGGDFIGLYPAEGNQLSTVDVMMVLTYVPAPPTNDQGSVVCLSKKKEIPVARHLSWSSLLQ
jgi:hypothetical protein